MPYKSVCSEALTGRCVLCWLLILALETKIFLNTAGFVGKGSLFCQPDEQTLTFCLFCFLEMLSLKKSTPHTHMFIYTHTNIHSWKEYTLFHRYHLGAHREQLGQFLLLSACSHKCSASIRWLTFGKPVTTSSLLLLGICYNTKGILLDNFSP